MIKKIFFLIILILIISIGIFYFKPSKDIDNRKKFTFWSIQLKPVYEKEILKIIDEFEKNHPDYKVVWVDIPIQEAQKRTLASVLSSNPPDLVNLNPDFSILLAQKGILEFFNEDDLKDYNKNILNKLKYQNKIYAVPFYATSPVTIYNKELFDKCFNKKFPYTYSELFKISPEIKACTNITPYLASINENDTFSKILNKFGIYSFNSDEEKNKAFEVYSMFNDMYKKELFVKDILSLNHREVIEKYMSNQTLSIVAGSNFIDMIKQNAPDIYSKSALSNQLTEGDIKYDVSIMNLIIPKKSSNKELAFEFALLLTNKENQLELAKVTNVLPVNKYALDDEYFKKCSDDLVSKARCIGAKQLNNIIEKDFSDKNKKEINELLNKTLEEILLNPKSDDNMIKIKMDKIQKQMNILQNN